MKLKLLIPALLLSCTSIQSYAQNSPNGDAKVNCTTSTVSTPYYYGWANCSDRGRTLSSNISRSAVQWVTLTERHRVGNNYVTYQCSGYLTQTGYDQRTVENCQYTPRAVIRQHYVQESYDSRTDTTYYQAGIAVAAFEYSDRDGHVTQVEKWVNGVSVTDHHIDVYEPTHVRLRVTDNHGHVTDTSKTITPSPEQICMRGGMLIICDGPT